MYVLMRIKCASVVLINVHTNNVEVIYNYLYDIYIFVELYTTLRKYEAQSSEISPSPSNSLTTLHLFKKS